MSNEWLSLYIYIIYIHNAISVHGRLSIDNLPIKARAQPASHAGLAVVNIYDHTCQQLQFCACLV